VPRLEWIQRVFEPATREKAGGKARILICDGHGSHVSADFVGFCIQHKIVMLLMPPHSSHYCQPLDVGVFSPLKTYMSEELDRIIRYGIANVKKFEWADCYRKARPKAFSPENILSGFHATGLFPLNRQKVLRRMGDKEREPDNEPSNNDAKLQVQSSAVKPNPFAIVPSTPSRIDPAILREANQSLISNINAGILDTPTKAFIPVLASYSEYCTTQTIITKYESEAKDKILRQRREVANGKRVVLKGKFLVTTEEIHAELKACEKATRAKKAKKTARARRTARNASGAQEHVADIVDSDNEETTGELEAIESA